MTNSARNPQSCVSPWATIEASGTTVKLCPAPISTSNQAPQAAPRERVMARAAVTKGR